MNTCDYLGASILELMKILMYQFWYDCVTPQYNEKAKFCYMDKDSFIVWIETGDLYKEIAENVKTGLDTSNFKL